MHFNGIRTILDELKVKVQKLKENDPPCVPRLEIIQVGARPDSNVYIKMKQQAASEVKLSLMDSVELSAILPSLMKAFLSIMYI